MKVPKVLVRAKERAEPIVKNFEWTWTTAVLFSLGFAFFSVITMAVIPSFWLYFAEQNLGLAPARPGLRGGEPLRRSIRDRGRDRGDHAELAAQAPGRHRRSSHRRVPVRRTSAMPFTKTE